MTIKQITNPEDVKKLFPLAEQFQDTVNFVLYDSGTILESWKHLLSTDAGVLITKEINGQIVGVIGGIKHPDITSGILTATEAFWFVAPNHRGCGIELLNAFELWAKEKNCKRVLMMALLDSMAERVMGIYKKAGYAPLEVTYIKEV